MLGAIIGDIVGSVYEWHNIKTTEFPFFREDCSFTDDTVMTIATADAIMKGGTEDAFIDAYKEWGKRYPGAGYGGMFNHWLYSPDRTPYNSCGNGSAMRVSPCAWVIDCKHYSKDGLLSDADSRLAVLSANVTHNHPEGIIGALAVTDAIFICRLYNNGYLADISDITQLKMRIREHIEQEYNYDLNRTLDTIRPDYRFNEICQETVPQAIIAFLESSGFESAIRNAISLGGDSDTLAAITGSIAEACYGVPDAIRDKALAYLDKDLLGVYERWQEYLQTL